MPTTELEDIYSRWDALVPPDLVAPLEAWVLELVARRPSSERELQACMTALRRATKVTPQKSQVTAVYLAMLAAGRVEACPELRSLLVKKSSKSQSGVLVRRRLSDGRPARLAGARGSPGGRR